MFKFMALLTGALVSFSFAQQQRFACVDPQVVMQESQMVKSRRSQLIAKREGYQKQLDEMSKKLEELKKQIDSKATAQKVREEKIKEFEKIQGEGIELQQRAQRELMELGEKLENEVASRVRSISEELAKSRGFSAIVDCSVFFYKSPELDITKEVVQRLDQQK
ncbi:MAG: OmpH family outer membrane protein [Aquificaceae bacterium]|nr:OmpH family outer membrane protein [Aquificaceae bacterium]MDW8237360.1 OmpH family outer membrane protein [Aquificaceae bacterium]